MISVLLVDNNAYILKSLQYLLNSADDIRVTGTSRNGVEAVTQAGSHCPSVVVMDISMPEMDGIKATTQIRLLCPATHVLILSMFETAEYIRRALDAGASGYVLKDHIIDDLVAAIRALSKGNRFFSQRITEIAETYLR